MAKSKIKNKRGFPRTGLISRGILVREKKLTEKYFDFLKCTHKSKKLILTGVTKPTTFSPEYYFRIEYDGFQPPSIYVISPKIEYNPEIHMYPKDSSLCLYWPKEMLWNRFNHNLFNTIIPWTLEWFVFYEKYKISGKWEHPEVHF